jgi:hypothetical protein
MQRREFITAAVGMAAAVASASQAFRRIILTLERADDPVFQCSRA